MALVEDAVEAITEGGLGVGAILGVGALLAWPLVRPVLREGTKMALKGGIGLYQWGAQTVAEARGGMSDLATEARQERGSSARRHGSSGATTESEDSSPA